MAPPLPFSSLLRQSASSIASSSSSSSAASVVCCSRRSMASVPWPILPYDPLRPVPKENPPPAPPGFVHPLAKWDTFLDIPSNPDPLAPIVANDPPIIPQRFPAQGSSSDDSALAKEILSAQVGLSTNDIRDLHKFVLGHKRVIKVTKGGRVAQHFIMCVVGSPSRGLLGIGQGKNPIMRKASDQAFNSALKNMDTVRRYQDRTVWGAGENMRIKYGAAIYQMRARPPGFGLRCAPTLHHMFTACGIKDISAKMYGSKNVMQSIKAMAHILHGGAKAPGLGNGLGGPGKLTDKGRGMRGVEEIELERGRYGVEIGSGITRL